MNRASTKSALENRAACERRPEIATEEVAMAPAQARRESEAGAALPPARPAPVQPEDRPGYLLKKALQPLWEYSSTSWAGKFLDEWCRQAMRSRIEPIKTNRPLAQPASGADS